MKHRIWVADKKTGMKEWKKEKREQGAKEHESVASSLSGKVATNKISTAQGQHRAGLDWPADCNTALWKDLEANLMYDIFSVPFLAEARETSELLSL